MRQLDLLLLDISGYGYLPPLGLLYVGSYAQSHGFTTGIQILQREPGGYSRRFLEELLRAHRPAVVGMPVMAESVVDVVRYCRWLREMSDAKLLLGGPEASADPEYVFSVTQADALVVGDGEERALSILNAWRQNRVPADLRGIYFRQNGQSLHDPAPPPYANLDTLPPPDFSLMINKDSHVRSMVTGRGCPFQCTFCFEGRNLKYRMRSVESVVDELEQILSSVDVRVFAFLDDTFTLNKKRLKRICEVLKKHYRGPWFCEGRIGILYHDPEIVDILADAGLSRIQLGLESGSQKVLDAYRKQTTPEEIRAVFKHCHEAGITSVIGNFIVGGAFEDDKTFAETLQIANDLIAECPGSAELTSCYLYPYATTTIAINPAAFDIEFLDDLRQYNAAGRIMCVNRTAGLSRGQIAQYRAVLQGVIYSRMVDQIDSLDPMRIDKHMRYARDNDIHSEWYQVLVSSCDAFGLYSRLQVEYGGRSWIELSGMHNWLQYCPMRIGYNNPEINGDAISVKARRSKRVEMTGLERRLYELSSGKLSLEEMLPHLRCTPGCQELSDEALEAKVYSACERLGQDFLLLYREV